MAMTTVTPSFLNGVKGEAEMIVERRPLYFDSSRARRLQG